MAKPKTSTEEKFQNNDFPLFPALEAIDRKDYGFYDRLTEEQKKKFVPFLLVKWASAIDTRNKDLQGYYVRATDAAANKFLFNEKVYDHAKLQWLMLCAISPEPQKQFHKYIPQIKESVIRLREPATIKDIKEYYTKVYPKADKESINEIAEAFVTEHKKKCYLAKTFPSLKQSDIDTLTQLVTDDDIKAYERDRGN